MNVDNVVLVRIMNNLPLNGELIPSSEVPCLVEDHSSDFSYFIYQLVKQDLVEKLGRPLTYEEESGRDSLLGKKFQEFVTKKSKDYTSTLSFSLNGMVPDDTNCKFQNMPMAVIDPIKFHTDANFVNVVVTDTTIKGRMKVSDSAILVINADYFKSLNDEIKLNLQANFKLKFFKGKLKTAIDATLKENNFPSLPLKQGHHDQKIGDCPEKESMLNFLEVFATSVKASRMSLTDLYQPLNYSDPVDRDASAKVNDYVEKSNIIDEYNKKLLYEFLIAKAESLGIFVSDDEKNYLFTTYPQGEDAMRRITSELIKVYGGLENFKTFSQEYNEYLKNNMISAEEIISLGESRK